MMLKNMQGLRGVSILGREAQKQLRGGSSADGGGSGTCAIYMPSGYNLTYPVTIDANDWYHSPAAEIHVGISKDTVTQLINSGGGTGVLWCCASCASAPWIPR